nr:hypothetical protein [Rhodoferax sp.]
MEDRKRMRKYLASLALVLASHSAFAIDTFDANSKKLTLDSVVFNGVTYNNVVVTLSDYTLNSVGTSAPYTGASGACTAAHFTTAKFNAISLGMSASQVAAIMGCASSPTFSQHQGNFTITAWAYTSPTTFQTTLISVWFDVTGSTVSDAYSGQAPTPYFKSSQGF